MSDSSFTGYLFSYQVFDRQDLPVDSAACCLAPQSPLVSLIFLCTSTTQTIFDFAVNPQAIAAERTLHELEFYKTPLVPTRIRSRMPSSLGASASSSNITDMFARKHSLILMGDHDRPTKRDKKTKGKGRSKETNETKPYAGTTGIKKRLAKVKAPNHDAKGKSASNEVPILEQTAVSSPKETIVPELPVPPPKEKDTFNVAAFPPSTSPAQQSSLRVGRAARSHLSRPIKKFSASYDDEDDKVGDESKKDLEMLTEAAKKVPTFEIPPGFSFAKEVCCLHVCRTWSS